MTKKLNTRKNNLGFTIVELLVVIVVITILAALTIVSFTGVSMKANTALAQSNANSIRNIAETYAAEIGSYPDEISSFSNNPYAKIPEGINLLSTPDTLNASNGANSVLWKYDGSIGSATGGTIEYWDFTTNNVSLNVIHLGTGLGTTQPAGAPMVVQVLVVAGGGGGGTWGGGGGGAGGMVEHSGLTVTPQAYAVVVGAGGAGDDQSTNADPGGNSSFGSIVALGGAPGCGYTIGIMDGGSAGGGNAQSPRTGGTKTQTDSGGGTGYGNNGGNGYFTTNYNHAGGGGGGASAVGANATASAGGAGGTGRSSSISGSSVTYAGGGGGTSIGISGGTGAAGGAGGGGTGMPTTAGGNATVNTGGGGGGGGNNRNGGNGGSGIVIISYATGSMSATGGTVTTSGGNTIHTFTSSGTFTVN